MAFSNEDELDIEAELTEFAQENVRKVALSALRFLTLASPVDTGRFRSNWVVGMGSPNDEILDSTDNVAVRRGRSVINSAPPSNNLVIWISNNLPYAQRLNNGHSEQVPKFFVEKAVRRAGININDGEL